MSSYDETFERWRANPAAFWEEAASHIAWDEPWDCVLDTSGASSPRWFPGGRLNTCYNALDRHVELGHGARLALVHDSPVSGSVRTWTYDELLAEVARCAGALRALGVEVGDRVLIYMPAVPGAIITMLASARLGAVHSVVFGGFASNELATRISDAKPRVIVSASCGIEGQRVIPYKPLLDRAIAMASTPPECCIVVQRPQVEASMVPGRDREWDVVMIDAQPVPCVPVASTDPLYILYTSGTTGMPKGVVRDNGGHAVALAWSMREIYGVEPGEMFWAASDLGWVVGHSYIVYGPLINGSTTVLYEGKPVGTPDAGSFWRVVAEHGVRVLFTAPTAFRAIRREDPEGALIAQYDLRHFQALFLAGERCDPETLRWAEDKLHVPVVDHWWQTESGWPMAADYRGLGLFPVRPGSCGKPVPGYDIHVLDQDGRDLPAGQTGDIAVKLPLPPGCLTSLWNNDAGYRAAYLTPHPGYYATADAGYLDPDGYLWVMSRTDDVINVAGHRLATGAMEEVLATHADVAECAVVGIADALKGEVPVGFVVLKAGVENDPQRIVAKLVQLVRDRIGPVASFKLAAVVPRLPKTRSGKILRGTIKKMAEARPFRIPPTIDDPAILDEIREALTALGFPRSEQV